MPPKSFIWPQWSERFGLAPWSDDLYQPLEQRGLTLAEIDALISRFLAVQPQDYNDEAHAEETSLTQILE
ncbi:MAG: hypothetical protein M3R24_21590 [Chloroflexota bacterium]|nr:hypothetical protein [Chloroflexota bacterium]